jgi:ADP-heptose:LPS heptosyltransferase
LLAVNLHGAGPQSTQALRRLEPAELWSFGPPDGPPWRDDEHEVDRWCRLVAWYGCDVDVDDLYLPSASAQPRRGPVLVHPGAAEEERRWPADRFASLARALAEGGHRVLVTAGPDERPLATWVAAHAGLAAGSIAGSMNLDALADLVADSSLVISSDTGIAHLATAFRTPSVVIFGPQPPSRWGPPADGRHRVFWSPSPDDAPSDAPGPHPALLRVDPADVLAAAEDLLAAAPRD